MANDQKIRVCLFSTVQQPNDVRLFYRECLSLVKAGYDVHLVVPAETEECCSGVQIHPIKRIKPRIMRIIFAPWLAIVAALKTKAMIYHFHDPELIPIGFLMRWLLNKRVVFDMRESTARQIMGKEWLPVWSRKFISICYRMIERICLKSLCLIVANDCSVNEYNNCYLVRNFPQVDEEIISRAWPIEKRLENPLLVYIGGVWESRGAIIYVELAKWLASRGHRFKFMIIGPYERAFGEKLKNLVRQYQLEDFVEITGRMDYPLTLELSIQATIGFAILKPIPNYTFCLAGKIVEYMMCGTPVLCSNFDHWRFPYVETEGTGMTVDPDNITQIYQTCEKMLNSPAELAKMSKRGMEAVRTKYNWDIEFKELLRCYDDLLKR